MAKTFYQKEVIEGKIDALLNQLVEESKHMTVSGYAIVLVIAIVVLRILKKVI